MGQISNNQNLAVSTTVSLANAQAVSPAFGSGNRRLFVASGTFTVPAGITSIRVRCFGAGGGGHNSGSGGGGGGGGYAHGVFSVAPSTPYTVTVGAGGSPTIAGGTTSFGALISATGGGAGSAGAGGAGGSGVGGDVQFVGGTGGAPNSYSGGGGGVANIFGNGGDGGNGGSGGRSGASGGGGGTGVTTGVYPGGCGMSGAGGIVNSVNAQPGYVMSLDMIGAGGGGGGCGSSYIAQSGANGGGGGGMSTSFQGYGGFPGGGAGWGASGANGLVIVEW